MMLTDYILYFQYGNNKISVCEEFLLDLSGFLVDKNEKT